MTEEIFEKFFDDAAVFPPGLAPLDQAVAEHIIRASDPVAERFVGPLVLPVAKIVQAMELAGGTTIHINAVAEAKEADQLESIIAENSTVSRVVGAEFKIGDLPLNEALERIAEFSQAHPDYNVYVELAYQLITDENLQTLRENNLNLKFRTGGVTEDLFPSPEEVIDVIDRALKQGLKFKFTAGLHRAMRYRDEKTGFHHFGFANIAAATDALQRGETRKTALQLLNSDDRQSIGKSITTADTSWREAFRSFGTCSVPEPTGTLADLGLMNHKTVQHLTIDDNK